MNKEIWKPIPWAKSYDVSNMGHVRSWRTRDGYGKWKRGCNSRLLKLSKSSKRYRRVSVFYDDGTVKATHVHELVLTLFDKPRPEGLMCRHLDGNPINNCLDNLKWGTPKENGQDTISHGRTVKLIGESNPGSKLKEGEVWLIKKILESGVSSQMKISKMFNVTRSCIQGIDNGRTWQHIEYGGANVSKA